MAYTRYRFLYQSARVLTLGHKASLRVGSGGVAVQGLRSYVKSKAGHLREQTWAQDRSQLESTVDAFWTFGFVRLKRSAQPLFFTSKHCAH